MADPWDEFESEMDAVPIAESGEEAPEPATGFTSRIINWAGKPGTVVSTETPEEHDKRLEEYQKKKRAAGDDLLGKKLKSAGSQIMNIEAQKSDRCRRHAKPGQAPHGAEVVALRSVGEVFDIAFSPLTTNDRQQKQATWCITAEGSPHILCLWLWSFTNDSQCSKCRSDVVPGSTKCRRCKLPVTTHAVLESA